jgi:hypothetical protein
MFRFLLWFIVSIFIITIMIAALSNKHTYQPCIFNVAVRDISVYKDARICSSRWPIEMSNTHKSPAFFPEAGLFLSLVTE